MNWNKLIVFFIIILVGATIKKTIEEEHPEIYNQYLEDRSKWKWYKRMWYLK